MSEHEQIEAGEDECCCCHADEVRLTKFTRVLSDEEHQHCDICYSTLVGNQCGSRAYVGDARDIMQHINMVANLLLKRLERRSTT